MVGYRVGELEQARSVEVDRFQQLLREEGERREGQKHGYVMKLCHFST